MEFRYVSWGDLTSLKECMSWKSRKELATALSATSNGSTLLLLACRHGYTDIAEYLIKDCKADIEQRGDITLYSETIENVTPLWCAAASGSLDMVKLLIKHGANVNSTTKTNSTPLRAACFDGHFHVITYLLNHGADMEIANRHGHTNLMIACYKGHTRIVELLIKKGADVNRRSVKGNTALHDSAEYGSIEIMCLLIENGAKMMGDSYGMTPLMAASVAGHTHVVRFFREAYRKMFHRQELIDAIELLGATYVDKKRDMVGALENWKVAMEYRYKEKPQMPKPEQKATVEAYGHAKEITDPNALDDLLSDPDEMRMQALLVRERILGPAHPDTSFYVRSRGAVYADAGEFERCLSLWTHALDMQQSMLEPLNPMTLSSFVSFTELFSFMMGEQDCTTRLRRMAQVSFKDIISVFDKAVNEVDSGVETYIKRFENRSQVGPLLNRMVIISLHLACLLAKLRPTLSHEEVAHLKRSVRRFLKASIVRGKKRRDPLQMACTEESMLVKKYPACTFPNPALVELLLSVGADVNVKDEDGNTPLHLAALSKVYRKELVQVLLSYGAHLDVVNDSKKTFEDLMRQCGHRLYTVVNTLKHTTLACLAARTIQAHNIPYKGVVPKSLEDFLVLH